MADSSLMELKSPRHSAAMVRDGAPSRAKPWWQRPIPLAGAGLALLLVVLVIALPAALVHKGGSSSDGSSSGHSGGSSGSNSSSTSTSSMAPTPTSYGGCGRTQSTGFSNDFTNQNLVSGDYTRNYSIFIPDSYNDHNSDPWPMILDFHGNSRTGTDQYNNSMYYNYTAGTDYLAIYPEGVHNSWQGAPYATKGVDDVQFVADLVTHLNDNYCIDTNRMYISGKSNGGGFGDLLACSDTGDMFAAYAFASAALYNDLSEDNCTKQRAMLESHGEADKTIPYDGSDSGDELPKIRSWVKWWSERDGCASSDVATSENEDGYEIDTYACDGESESVKHYAVKDMGHCWPSSTGDNYDAQYDKCDDRSLDFTPVVLSWFGNWTLQNAPGS